MKKGFTLVEVMVAIGIIGIISVMTVPIVVMGSHKKELVANLKEAFSSLKRAAKSSETDNDVIRAWTWTNRPEDFDTYFKKYLNIIQDCGTTPGDCFIEEYKSVAGTEGGKTFSAGSRYVVLVNGKTCAFTPKEGGGSFFVDVNGKKGPNRYGIDLFEFVVTSGTGVKPACFDQSAADINARCNATGECCAQKVILEDKIDY